MPGPRVLIPLILAVMTGSLQACYQDSPLSTPPQTVDSLVSLLDDRDRVIRRTAAEALGKIGERRAIPHLVSSLGDESPVVREAAARSLGRLGPLTADDGRRLATLLQDPFPAVQQAAAQSLGSIELSQEILSEMIATLPLVNSEARMATISALVGLDLPRTDENLIRLATDEAMAIRQMVVAVLGDQGNDQGVDVLLNRLQHDVSPAVRAESAYRLGFHLNPTVQSALDVTANQDSNLQVCRWARQSLAGTTMRDGSDSMPLPIQ